MTCERSCLWQIHPSCILTRRLEHRGDELHSGDAVIHRRNLQRWLRRRALGFACSNLFGDVGVDLREGFEIALGMTGGNAAGVLGGFGGRWSTPCDELRRLAVRAETQRVGFLLAPLNPGFF